VGDSLDADKKAEVEQALAKLREALGGEDVEAIDTATEALTKASHALAEALYAKNAQQAASGEGGDDHAHGAEGGGGSDDDNVVDAEYEEVQDNK
jgi:molecular chaperone DnaK